MNPYDYMHRYGWEHMGPWGGWGMMLWMGLFWLFVVVGMVVLIRYLALQARGSGSSLPPPETPIDVLKKRYARGEISKDEYEKIKKDIAA